MGVQHVRIIPALAGNTVSPTVSSASASDHPRSRGEYAEESRYDCRKQGSSPLSRGILSGHIRNHRTGRIIPALAGNTIVFLASADLTTDHPRSRGEYWGRTLESRIMSGSSPLSRGIPCHRILTWCSPRIIPALAGNTVAHTCKRCATWDHPRSRGEYLGQHVNNMNAGGSSPLSRGIRLRLQAFRA